MTALRSLCGGVVRRLRGTSFAPGEYLGVSLASVTHAPRTPHLVARPAPVGLPGCACLVTVALAVPGGPGASLVPHPVWCRTSSGRFYVVTTLCAPRHPGCVWSEGVPGGVDRGAADSAATAYWAAPRPASPLWAVARRAVRTPLAVLAGPNVAAHGRSRWPCPAGSPRWAPHLAICTRVVLTIPPPSP